MEGRDCGVRVDSVSPEHHGTGGIPRARRGVALPLGRASRKESWPGANEAKAEKLGVRSLKRQAAAQGLQLRHSDSGYSLIDSARKPVNDRNDMTLAEVESWLGRA
jgi:hypothetical protein